MTLEGDVRGEPTLSRRNILAGATTAPAVLAAMGGTATMLASAPAEAEVLTPTNQIRRFRDAANLRKHAAWYQFAEAVSRPAQETNDDDDIYADYRGSFHKCLPHNDFGEVDPAAYEALRYAFDCGDPDAFDAIPLDGAADRRLANPQGALAFNLTGIDPHATRMRAAPAFASAESAAEMGEVYWHAILRDTPFADWGSSALAGDAVDDLNAFSETVGPTQGGLVTAATLFRGPTPGDLVGPYVSQFLLKDVNYGQALIEQRYNTPDSTNFMTEVADWLAVQRGSAPGASISYAAQRRYIYNARALGEYVHIDALFQAYLFAAAIGLGFGSAALDVTPYSGNPNQGAFTTLGGPDVLDSVSHVANLSLRAAWFQKWAAHRRLRPEMYAGRVHFTRTGDRNYGLPAEILNSGAVSILESENGTALLPMAFAEGSPTHPSYPAGHATVAGSCCTVLKAFFDESFVIPDPVVASSDGLSLLPYGGGDLTLGGEINKLASNISLGRDLAGVHYRSDGVDGILVGEQIGLAYLADISRGYNEDFGGFSLTRFDGSEVLVADGQVFDV
ncbi:MAG: vanadium-dependent haloperoxidase [Nannocystales bacterium]